MPLSHIEQIAVLKEENNTLRIKVNTLMLRSALLDDIPDAFLTIMDENKLTGDYAEDGRYAWPRRWNEMINYIMSLT